MRIKKLNEQFSQTFSGDGFNSSNGVFKVKYKSYDDLSQARGREINPYDHVKGEEFQAGDIVLAKLKSGKGRKKIEAVIVSSSKSEDGKSLSFKIRSLNTNKIHSVPVHAIEFAQDRGHVNTERGKSGSTISNKQKFLTSLKYNAGNFIWGSLESKKNNLKSDILLNESGSNIERPGLIDPSVRIVLINSANPDYQTHIENFKKLGILYSIPEEKTILRPTYVGYRRKMVKQKITSYPASVKHFIIKCRVNPQFQPHKKKVRDAAIDILLNSKK